jgi:hypothetical protein
VSLVLAGFLVCARWLPGVASTPAVSPCSVCPMFDNTWTVSLYPLFRGFGVELLVRSRGCCVRADFVGVSVVGGFVATMFVVGRIDAVVSIIFVFFAFGSKAFVGRIDAVVSVVLVVEFVATAFFLGRIDAVGFVVSVFERVCSIGVDVVEACLCGFFGFGSKADVLFLVRIGGFPFAVFLVFEFGATTFFLVRIDAVVFGIFVSVTVAGCRFEANVPVVVLVDGFISV